MQTRWIPSLLTCCLLATGALAAAPEHRMAEVIKPFVDQNEISGAVTLVAQNGRILSFEAAGLADVGAGRPMRKDDLFWIASMTKPMAGVAILMLQEEGKLSVDDPVEQHLPEFKDAWLVESKSADQVVLKRPLRKITIKDLLTHTAGIPNVEVPRSHSTLAEVVAMASQQPLQFEPGSRWSYSNAGIDTAGRIVEVVSGKSYDEFLEERIFRPLGMKNTSFHPGRSQARRIARSYEKNKTSGELEETPVYFLQSEVWDDQRTVRPAGGLFSTAEDMFRFYQMMLDGGAWKGRRLLSKESVAVLTRTQTGDIQTGFTDGMSWGLGFQVVKKPQGVTAMLSPGTFGHGGAYGTQSWADPETGVIYVLMIQRRGFPNGDNSDVRRAFQTAAQEWIQGR